MIYSYLLTAIRLTPGGSGTIHIYTQTIHRTTQVTINRTTQLIYAWFSTIRTVCPSMESYRHFNSLWCLNLQGSGSQGSLTVHHEGSGIPQNVAERYPMT
jgi:hypothetical protein